MLRHWLNQPELLLALVLLPVVALVASRDARRRQRVLAGIGGVPALANARRGIVRALRGPALLLGLVALGVAVAGPRWGQDFSQPTAPGRDLVVVLDCSKSMFAETPSRFERARAALTDLADTLRRVGGHRVALVTFAARARLVCPLTNDYDHFRETVAALDPQTFDTDLGPAGESLSGTRIGQGLLEAVRAHDSRFGSATDVLLLSDGDDPARDGEWQKGIGAARAAGIPVYAVGIGDPDTASVIARDNRPLRYDGKEVRTKLEETPLRTIAEETGGLTFPAGTRPIALGSLYLDAVAGRPQRDDAEDTLPVFRDRSAWFYGSAFGLLAGSILLGDIRPPRSRRNA
jgi:Ca-activated chloride channel family protein